MPHPPSKKPRGAAKWRHNIADFSELQWRSQDSDSNGRFDHRQSKSHIACLPLFNILNVWRCEISHDARFWGRPF